MTMTVRSGTTRGPGNAASTAAADSSRTGAGDTGVRNTARKNPPPEIGSQQWQEMVAAAAYYRAEARGFRGSSPEQDWLEAEAELLERLAPKAERPTPKKPKSAIKGPGKRTR
ncbi:MAG TPA: DUF2934 domain-containing protein [Burkholderiales bacterium]|jgi:hypothetical protein|nr:DUF2934 domain-containing protein [Burkholderiales bacterium]